MYARMTKLHDVGGDLEAAVQTVKDNVIPRAREIDGFKGFLGFVDRETGTFMSFSLWETEDAMRASESAANQLRQETVKLLGSGEPTVKRFEAVIVEVPATVTV
jgi:heme-degrading monooxygenase HmoA